MFSRLKHLVCWKLNSLFSQITQTQYIFTPGNLPSHCQIVLLKMEYGGIQP
jgi:hypothetical protein